MAIRITSPYGFTSIVATACDTLDYEIRNARRRVAPTTGSRPQTFDDEHITSSGSGNGGQRMCQFLCQFDSFFDEQWRTSANTGTGLNRSWSIKAGLSLFFLDVTKRIKRPLLYH